MKHRRVTELSAGDREKIQLLHLSKLSELIYSIVSVVGDRVVLPAELTQGEVGNMIGAG